MAAAVLGVGETDFQLKEPQDDYENKVREALRLATKRDRKLSAILQEKYDEFVGKNA